MRRPSIGSPRSWLVLGALAGLLAACASPATEQQGGGDEQDTGDLVVVSWGGRFTESTRKHLADPFSKETGIEVSIVDSPGTQVTKLQAMHKANNVQWDVIDSSGAADAFYLNQQELLAPLPADTKQAMVDSLGADKVSDFGFTYANLGYVIVCNDKVVRRCPKTIPEFFDAERFPGKREMPGQSYSQTMPILAQAAGKPVDDAVPVDIDEAMAQLKRIKPSVSVWWTSGDQMEQSLRQGEADMGILYSGRAYSLRNGGMDLTINWAGVYDPGYTAVVKGAPHEKEAQQFLRWVVDHPEAQAKWAEAMQYSVPSPKALDLMPREVAVTLADHPDNYPKLAKQDFEWYLANKSRIDKEMQRIIQGG